MTELRSFPLNDKPICPICKTWTIGNEIYNDEHIGFFCQKCGMRFLFSDGYNNLINEIQNITAEGDAMQKKIEASKNLLIDVCEDYGTECCQENICDCDGGWERCLTRKILDILEGKE